MRALIIIIIIALLAGGGYWIYKSQKDKKDKNAEVETSISAFNQTKNIDATSANAAPRDVIVYTLTVKNTSKKVVSAYETSVDIADITEGATLIDAQGANYNSSNNSLVWTPLDVPSEGSFDKKFTVRIKDVLPASSDYALAAQYTNQVVVNVDRGQVAATPTPNPTPSAKPVPPPSPYNAPTTGPTTTIILILAAAITAATLLFQVGKKIFAKA